jgi:hypothetical protein
MPTQVPTVTRDLFHLRGIILISMPTQALPEMCGLVMSLRHVSNGLGTTFELLLK